MEFIKINKDNLKSDSFKSAFKVYEKSFPSDERRDLEDLKKVIREGNKDYNFFSIEDYTKLFEPLYVKENMGMIDFWIFPEVNASYGEHVAIRQNTRNRGIGTVVINKFLTELTPTEYTVIEAEKPEIQETDEMHRIALRRLGLYDRIGFVLSDFFYIQPPYSEGKQPVPLNILYHSKSGKKLSYSEFEAVRDRIYASVYNFHKSLEDLNEMLKTV